MLPRREPTRCVHQVVGAPAPVAVCSGSPLSAVLVCPAACRGLESCGRVGRGRALRRCRCDGIHRAAFPPPSPKVPGARGPVRGSVTTASTAVPMHRTSLPHCWSPASSQRSPDDRPGRTRPSSCYRLTAARDPHPKAQRLCRQVAASRNGVDPCNRMTTMLGLGYVRPPRRSSGATRVPAARGLSPVARPVAPGDELGMLRYEERGLRSRRSRDARWLALPPVEVPRPGPRVVVACSRLDRCVPSAAREFDVLVPSRRDG